jgi:hypothetical protein
MIGDTPTIPSSAAVAALAGTSLVPYLLVEPTHGFIDKGELVAVASTLGIPHPTAYPTSMMLGHLEDHAPAPVIALNVMPPLTAGSAVCPAQ